MVNAGAMGRDIYRLKCCKSTGGPASAPESHRGRGERGGGGTLTESRTRPPAGAETTTNIGLGDALQRQLFSGGSGLR